MARLHSVHALQRRGLTMMVTVVIYPVLTNGKTACLLPCNSRVLAPVSLSDMLVVSVVF